MPRKFFTLMIIIPLAFFFIIAGVSTLHLKIETADSLPIDSIDFETGVRILASSPENTHGQLTHLCAGGYVVAHYQLHKRGFAYTLNNRDTDAPLKCEDYDLETYLKHTHEAHSHHAVY